MVPSVVLADLLLFWADLMDKALPAALIRTVATMRVLGEAVKALVAWSA